MSGSDSLHVAHVRDSQKSSSLQNLLDSYVVVLTLEALCRDSSKRMSISKVCDELEKSETVVKKSVLVEAINNKKKTMQNIIERILKKLPSERSSGSQLRSLMYTTSSLKTWKEKGVQKPTQGRELTNLELAKALESKTEFSADEWSQFGIGDLREDDFIESDGKYFHPSCHSEFTRTISDIFDNAQSEANKMPDTVNKILEKKESGLIEEATDREQLSTGPLAVSKIERKKSMNAIHLSTSQTSSDLLLKTILHTICRMKSSNRQRGQGFPDLQNSIKELGSGKEDLQVFVFRIKGFAHTSGVSLGGLDVTDPYVR